MPSAQKFCGLFIVRNNKKRGNCSRRKRPASPDTSPPLLLLFQSVSHAVLVSLSRHWLNLCGPKSFCTLSTRKELFRIKFAVMAAPVTHQVSSCRPLLVVIVIVPLLLLFLLLLAFAFNIVNNPTRLPAVARIYAEQLMHSAPACRKTTQPATEVAKNFVPQLANSSCDPLPPSPSLLLCPLLCCCCASSAAAPVLTVVN